MEEKLKIVKIAFLGKSAMKFEISAKNESTRLLGNYDFLFFRKYIFSENKKRSQYFYFSENVFVYNNLLFYLRNDANKLRDNYKTKTFCGKSCLEYIFENRILKIDLKSIQKRC